MTIFSPSRFRRAIPVGSVAFALVAFFAPLAADEHPQTPVSEAARAMGQEGPYDLRGLTIDPSENEPRSYAVPSEADRVHITRGATASYTLPENPRMIAEWEKVQGAVIRYPLGISVDAVKTIASELTTYVLCSSLDQSKATTAFRNGGVNMNNVKFITATTDTYWTRDYSAWWIECGPANKRTIMPVDVIYRPNGVRPNDDKVPTILASYFNLPTYYPLKYVCQGGNIMGDGVKTGASTDRIIDETANYTLAQMQKMGKDTCGLSPYYVMEDPLYPEDYIKHIDCWAKFIPGNKVLVKRVASSSQFYTRVEAAARDWASRTNDKGQKITVIRVDGTDESPYVNHVVLNDRVLVPAVGNSTLDNKAISQIQAAYGSSFRVIGVKSAPNLPWLGTDSIHCRVNSIPVLKAVSTDTGTDTTPDNGDDTGTDNGTQSNANLALNRPVIASSASAEEALAVDGNDSTYWASAHLSNVSKTQSLSVDFGASHTVSRMRVKFSANNYPKVWSLQYQSGQNWYNAYTTNYGKGGVQEMTFSARTARNWRIQATSNNANYYTVYEFQLFN